MNSVAFFNIFHRQRVLHEISVRIKQEFHTLRYARKHNFELKFE
jgi:hypothetical protein